jgi:pantetheine-phosphate adenylyltransferase
MIAIYPGSFDPLTKGHLSIIRRAARLFDELIVVVSYNPRKKTMFSIDERVRLIRESVSDFPNVQVDSVSNKLTVDYARQRGAGAIVKGLRNQSDFQSEFQQYNMNHQLAPDLESVLMLADNEEIFVSSTIVRDLIRQGGAYERFVPKSVEAQVEGLS